MSTLFIHHFANIQKEIMPQDLGCSSNDFTIEMLFLKHLVNIRTVTMHICGEPFDRPALLVENRFDNMSYMKLRHSCI